MTSLAAVTLAAIAALHIAGMLAIGVYRTNACAERGIEFCLPK